LDLNVLLLALDTATAAVAVAVHDGQRVLAERVEVDARHHAELLAPMLVATLAEAGATRADLTAIACGVGPGPFTGLRAGIVTATVLGHTLGVDVYGVCSLDAFAEAAAAPSLTAPSAAERSGLAGGFVVATDARRREVYWARYEPILGTGPRRVEGPLVGPPDDAARAGLPVVGPGGELYPGQLGPPHQPTVMPAGALAGFAVRALAGSGTGLLPPRPLYLRRPDAAVPGPRKRVLR
jgi:tRNA threonylcarbamoyl adenosine modification protein YeaZ